MWLLFEKHGNSNRHSIYVKTVQVQKLFKNNLYEIAVTKYVAKKINHQKILIFSLLLNYTFPTAEIVHSKKLKF